MSVRKPHSPVEGKAFQHFSLVLYVFFELYAAVWCGSQGCLATSRYGSEYFSNSENTFYISVFATASPGLQPDQFDQTQQRAGVIDGETNPDMSTRWGESQRSSNADLHCLFLYPFQWTFVTLVLLFYYLGYNHILNLNFYRILVIMLSHRDVAKVSLNCFPKTFPNNSQIFYQMKQWFFFFYWFWTIHGIVFILSFTQNILLVLCCLHVLFNTCAVSACLEVFGVLGYFIFKYKLLFIIK